MRKNPDVIFFRGVVFGGAVAEYIAESVNSYYACLLGPTCVGS